MKQTHFLLLLAGLFLAACQEDPAPTAAPVSAPTAETASITATPTAATALTSPVPPTATAAPTATATAVPPTATPVPPKTLTVCMANLPKDVYLYGDTSLQATAVRHALYENLTTTIGFAYQPQGLDSLPTLENGGFSLQPIAVTSGDIVVKANGTTGPLRRDDSVINSAGEVESFTGNTIEMVQMVVDFTFQPLVWSDGTPLTADDSVFSYEVAADGFTLSDKTLVERTASYEAVDDLTVRWTGIPGHRNNLYLNNVWMPLPRHQLGTINPLRLPETAEAALAPLSTGPFVVSSWEEGQIVLEPNPYYYRTAEGLPHLEQLIFTAVAAPTDVLALISTGQCDVVTQELLPLDTPNLAQAADQGATLQVQEGVVWEHIAFGINSYGREAKSRPDWFQDSRVRQALLQCTNRAQMAADFTNGLANLTDSYLPASHPLATGLPAAPAYDPTAANALLDAVGYVDKDGDGLRDDIETNATFSITLRTTASTLRTAVAEQFAADAAACGIQVDVVVDPSPKFFAADRDGSIFGRNFDATLFGWAVGVDPACEHYQSQEISGPQEERFVGWLGANVTGYYNPAFDRACQAGQTEFYGTAAYNEAHTAALTIFATDWPSIPLFARPKLSLTAVGVQNVQLDGSQPSELWNVAKWDMVP